MTDERVVGEGLRARLGLEQDDIGSIDPRAYLEKIIQWGSAFRKSRPAARTP